MKPINLVQIKAGRNVVNRHWQDPSNIKISDGLEFTPFLERLEKRFKETGVCGQLPVEIIPLGCDEMVGKVVVFVDD